MTFREWLITKNVCRLAWEWVNDRTAEQAWAECPDSLWMEWMLMAARPSKRLQVSWAISAARSVQHRNLDARVGRAINTAQAWLDGKTTEEECRLAANSAISASFASFSVKSIFSAKSAAKASLAAASKEDAALNAVASAVYYAAPAGGVADI